jgi:hypothetical protein
MPPPLKSAELPVISTLDGDNVAPSISHNTPPPPLLGGDTVEGEERDVARRFDVGKPLTAAKVHLSFVQREHGSGELRRYERGDVLPGTIVEPGDDHSFRADEAGVGGMLRGGQAARESEEELGVSGVESPPPLRTTAVTAT